MPENTAFLFAAFAITALLIFGYCLFMGGRIGGLRQDVEALREELAARTPESLLRAVGDEPAGETTTAAGVRRE
jgi:CcmD family protein